mmetsp:Transcript_18828/g.27771  ORF Transcript_18828/g.27771 Transcript_18828/m.27771 type:complete len:145 (+) Transcript_18828:68-502(+)
MGRFSGNQKDALPKSFGSKSSISVAKNVRRDGRGRGERRRPLDIRRRRQGNREFKGKEKKKPISGEDLDKQMTDYIMKNDPNAAAKALDSKMESYWAKKEKDDAAEANKNKEEEDKIGKENASNEKSVTAPENTSEHLAKSASS